MGKADENDWAAPGVKRRFDRRDGGHPTDLLVNVQEISQRFLKNAEQQSVGDRLVEPRRTIDQLEATWLSACADYDAAGMTAEDGANSLASWFRMRCQLAPGEAARRARVATAITTGTLQETGDAMRAGQISWRHAAVIATTVVDAPASAQHAAEQVLQEAARQLDPMLLRRVAAELLHRLDVEKAEERSVRRLERRGLTCAETFDGMVAISGLLDPVSGAMVQTALDAKLRPPIRGNHGDGHDDVGSADAADTRSWPQRRADALTDICREWMELGRTPTVAGQHPHVTVIVDHATLRQQPPTRPLSGNSTAPQEKFAKQSGPCDSSAQLSWVGPITPKETQFILCDSVVSRVVMGPQGTVLDVGCATRTIPFAIRTAVTARDRVCVAPGCHRPPEHCDIHHIKFWEHGGRTAVDNLAMVCRVHHRAVHQQNWTIQRMEPGGFTLAPPTGRHPPPR